MLLARPRCFTRTFLDYLTGPEFIHFATVLRGSDIASPGVHPSRASTDGPSSPCVTLSADVTRGPLGVPGHQTAPGDGTDMLDLACAIKPSLDEHMLSTVIAAGTARTGAVALAENLIRAAHAACWY